MELVVFVGLQASGKSTFYRECFAQTHAHVSKDLFRNNKNRSRRQEQLIREAFAAGRSMVVDNTNPTAEERRSLVALGHEHGAKVIGYFFDSTVRECLMRNRRRTGKARVPDVALYATAKKLVSPSYEEGLDELYDVRIVEAGPAGGPSFEVRGRPGDAESAKGLRDPEDNP